MDGTVSSIQMNDLDYFRGKSYYPLHNQILGFPFLWDIALYLPGRENRDTTTCRYFDKETRNWYVLPVDFE